MKTTAARAGVRLGARRNFLRSNVFWLLDY